MTKKLTCVDLFSGCGGLSTGLYKANIQGMFAVERSADAFATLRHNLIDRHHHFDWPNWLPQINLDINHLLTVYRGQLAGLRNKIDLVVGGPPCQGFSMAGRRQQGDARNNLIFSYLALVELIQPRAIMFENVRGFTLRFKANAEQGVKYSQIVTDKLKQLGYSDVRGEIINMADYGVPQTRERFIVIATRENLADEIFDSLEGSRSDFLTKKHLRVRNTAQHALSDLEMRRGTVPSPDSRGFLAGRLIKPKSKFQEYVRREDTDRLSPDSHRFVNHTDEVVEVFSRLLESAPRNRKIDGELREAYGLKKRSIAVLDPNKPTQTITTIPDDFVHYSEPRVMTVRECARLQSFPDWFEFKGRYTTGGARRVSQTPRYTQVGNAVPPLFAEQIGLAIRKVMNHA